MSNQSVYGGQGRRKETEPEKGEEVTKLSEELKDEVLQKYTQLSTGLGRLEKSYHIDVHVDPTVIPVVDPSRTVLAAPRDRVNGPSSSSRQNERRTG